jgi:ubiquinone/menaquinone biosynthesis C-methylase UbiE
LAEIISAETHWEQAAKTRMGTYLTQIETHFIQNNINLQQTKTIMDVGAEAGRFSQFSKTNLTETISIDIDKYGLKRLKHNAKDTNTVQADARKIPLKDEVFDAVFMIEVLDYVPELHQALAECRRTLKPNASVILSFGNKSSLKAKLRELTGKSYQHSYRHVIQTLTETGFQVKKKTGYNWLLFGRMSENPLIPFLAKMERLFGFRKIPSLSPWVIVHAIKSN